MSLYSKLDYDYTKISMLIADIEAFQSDETLLRRPLFKKLKKELLILHEAEDETVYEALEEHKETESLVDQLRAENLKIETLLSDLEKRNTYNSEQWHKMFAKLKYLMNQQIEDEEKLLVQAQKALSQPERERLEDRLDAAKRQLWSAKTVTASEALKSDFSQSGKAA